MEATALGSMTFINKYEDVVTFYTEMITIFFCNDSLQFIQILIKADFCSRLILFSFIIMIVCAKLVN